MTINLFLESDFYKADNDFLSFPIYFKKNTCSGRFCPSPHINWVFMFGELKTKKNAEMNISCSVNHWHVFSQLLRSGVHPLLAPVPQIYIERYASRVACWLGDASTYLED